MKRFTGYTKFGWVVVAALALSVGCRKPCKDVICENQGQTREADKECVCDCTPGYEGDRCQDLMRTRFIANWGGTETCDNGGSTTYFIRITAGDSVQAIDIANIGDFGFDHIVTGIVDGEKFTIAAQQAGGKTFSGDGTYEGGVLSLAYKVSEGAVSISCTGTYEVLQ